MCGNDIPRAESGTLANIGRRLRRWILIVVLITIVSPSTWATPVKIYWTANGQLFRANPDGSQLEVIASQPNIFGVALDNAGRVYYSSWLLGTISRIAKDGSGVPETLYSSLSQPQGLSLDLTTNRLYWTATTGGAIQFADLDGGGAVSSLWSGLSVPTGLDVDSAEGKVYWTTWTAGRVERGSLDGSGSVELVAMVVGAGLNDGSPAIDPVGQKLYWGYQSGELMRRNADGSGDIEVLFTGLGAPDGIALDVAEGKIYFASDGNMMRANMDGTGTPEILFPASASNIVLDFALFNDGFESGDTTAWFSTLE